MQDRPSPIELVTSVARLLQTNVLPQSPGRLGFEIRVAINALELVARQLAGADAAHAAEAQRLENLLGQSGSLADLNRELCLRIANDATDIGDPGLLEHLWATTLEKLAVDQPSYAAFRDEQQRNAKG